MATPPPRRPLTNASNTTPRTSVVSPSSISRPLGSTPPSVGQGLARNPSLRARPLRKAAIRQSMDMDAESDENEFKNTTSQLIADLQEQLERAEHASEQYRKQLEVLQLRLDEATDQQIATEERDFASRTRIDQLIAEVKDFARQKRDLEVNFESERSIFLQDQDRSNTREIELRSRVGRLTESLQNKSLERANTPRTGQFSDDDLQTPTQASSNHHELLQILQEKDAAIDTLKLELADFHIKVAEQEHLGDGRLQGLEKQLRDIKMQNARLVEENDSFQMLLGEKTLKGDFLHDAHSDSEGVSSLAEELESIGENDEVTVEQYRKVEADLKNTKEEKKALTLYIDKIIGRLLQHEGFEYIITGKEPEVAAPSPPPKSVLKEKPLPIAPSTTAPAPPTSVTDSTTVVGGFLQRARSVVNRGGPGRPARPMSYVQATPSANENPETAPRIPINKGHRRARSDQTQSPDLNPSTSTLHPGNASPQRNASGSHMSPPARAQTSYFAPPARTEAVKAPTQAGTTDPPSSANSFASGDSLDRQSTDATSAQASTHASDHRAPMGTQVTAGVMKQNQLRPLRLVQNQDAEDEARKKANRQSWMGNWFAKGNMEVNQ